MGRVHMRD